MHTTLRIDDEVYLQVKAKSNELGLSITRFFEEAAQERLTKLEQQPVKRIKLPVSSTSGPPIDEETLRKRIEAVDLANDLSNLK